MHSRILVPIVALAAWAVTTPTSSDAAVATHVNECWSTDNGPVVLDSLDLSATEVDVTDGPATIHVVADAHDTGGPGPATGIATMRLVTSTGSTTLHRDHGHWVGRLRIPQGAPAQQASGDVIAVDRGGRGTDMPAEGPGGYVVAVSDAAPDHTKPELVGLRIARHHVDSTAHAARVGVTATVTDAGSGVARVVVGSGTNALRSSTTHLSHVPGTNRYRGVLTIPRWNGDHAGYLFARASDRLGNEGMWWPGSVRDAGFDAFLRVTSGPRDRQPPRLVRLVRVPHVVDVRRHPETTVVEAVLGDNRGVRRAWVTGYGVTSLHRVSGTPRRGLWRAWLRIPRCGHGPASPHLELSVLDAAQHATSAGIGRLRVRALDRAPFGAHEVGPLGPSVTAAFNEPVHGITSTKVLVEDGNGDVVDGTWVCRNADAATVSCLTGAVRRATFTWDSPTADPADIVWEPPGHLDVLDRAGNPAADNDLVLDD